MRTLEVTMNGTRRTVILPEMVKGIVTVGQNLDSALSILFLQQHGEELLPGIQSAPLVEWTSAQPPDGRSVEEWVRDGFIPVNCGGWIFDHHPHDQFPGCCAATLVLDFLGLGDEPFLAELKRYVVWDDTRDPQFRDAQPDRAAGAFCLGPLFKYKVSHKGSAQALEWLRGTLDTYYTHQERFLCGGRTAWENAVTVRVAVEGGKRVQTICAGITDAPEFARFARSSQGSRADVVIQVRSSGNVQITCRKGFYLNHLAILVRLEEQRARSTTGTPWCTSIGALLAEGTIGEVPEWYYLRAKGHTEASMLLNGTERHTGVEPTRIGGWTARDGMVYPPTREQTRDRLVEIVRAWLTGPYARSPQRIPETEIERWKAAATPPATAPAITW